MTNVASILFCKNPPNFSASILKYYDIILQLFTIIQYFIGPVGQLKCAAPCWPWICSTLVQGVSSSSWTEFALSIIRWVLRSHVGSHVMGSVSWRGSLKMILNCNEAWRNMTGNVQPEGLPIEKDPRWAYCAPCSMKNEPSVGLPGQSDITHRDFWSIACLALVECVMYMGTAQWCSVNCKIKRCSTNLRLCLGSGVEQLVKKLLPSCRKNITKRQTRNLSNVSYYWRDKVRWYNDQTRVKKEGESYIQPWASSPLYPCSASEGKLTYKKLIGSLCNLKKKLDDVKIVIIKIPSFNKW